MLSRFAWAHATHPDWKFAASLCLAQMESSLRRAPRRPTLGILYLTDAYAEVAQDILAFLRTRLGVAQWVGGLGIGLAAGSAEYLDEPAMALMLLDYDSDDFAVFSGRDPLSPAHPLFQRGQTVSALVHTDQPLPELPGLLDDLAQKLNSTAIYGASSSSRHTSALIANSVYSRGITGLAFNQRIAHQARLTIGCHPLAPAHRITHCAGQQILELDHEPALKVLLRDLGEPAAPASVGASAAAHLPLIKSVQDTLIGLGKGPDFSHPPYQVHPLLGIDPHQHALVLAEPLEAVDHLVFFQKDRQAASLDLTHTLTALRDHIEQRHGSFSVVRGALYLSCLERAGPQAKSAPEAEMRHVQQLLGELPLIGLYGNAEIFQGQRYQYGAIIVLLL